MEDKKSERPPLDLRSRVIGIVGATALISLLYVGFALTRGRPGITIGLAVIGFGVLSLVFNLTNRSLARRTGSRYHLGAYLPTPILIQLAEGDLNSAWSRLSRPNARPVQGRRARGGSLLVFDAVTDSGMHVSVMELKPRLPDLVGRRTNVGIT